MIFVVGHEKGGVGKSLIAVNLAAHLAKKYSVVLVDTDTQMTASKWGELRTHFRHEHTFTIVDKAVDPTEHIRKLSENYDVVVVDVGAHDYSRLSELARIVDLWIAPTRVGQGDLESTLALADAFDKANHRHKRGKIPLVVTVNSVPGAWNTTEGADAVEALRQSLPGVPILQNTIRDRKVWRDAHRLGKSVFEMAPMRT
ncbi:AAA family ATPase (plasmid) [Polaromonas sp. P1-6]|nr:AAA family ATPase [Polaromonas sp. P1-6]